MTSFPKLGTMMTYPDKRNSKPLSWFHQTDRSKLSSRNYQNVPDTGRIGRRKRRVGGWSSRAVLTTFASHRFIFGCLHINLLIFIFSGHHLVPPLDDQSTIQIKTQTNMYFSPYMGLQLRNLYGLYA